MQKNDKRSLILGSFIILSFITVVIIFAVKISDFFYGLLLGMFIYELVGSLESFRVHRSISYMFIIGGIVALFTIVIFKFIPMLANFVQILYKDLCIMEKNGNLMNKSLNLLIYKIPYQTFFNLIKEFLSNLNNTANSEISSFAPYLQSMFKRGANIAQILSSMMNTVFGVICILFNIQIINKYTQYFQLIPLKKTTRNKMIQLYQKIRNNIKLFFLYQTIVASINAFIFTSVLVFFGVIGANIIGVLIFLLSFATSFGSVFGTIMCISTAMIQGFGLHSILIMFNLFIVIYLLENYVLLPKFIFEKVRVNSFFIVPGLLLSMKLFGMKYLICTVPAIIIMKEIINYLILEYHNKNY